MITSILTRQAIWYEGANATVNFHLNRMWKKECNYKIEKLFKITVLFMVYTAFYVTLLGKFSFKKSVYILNRNDPSLRTFDTVYIFYKSLEIHSKKKFEEIKNKKYPNVYTAWCIDSIGWMLNNPLIPKEYSEDPILRQNCCKITHQPIRQPVYEEKIDKDGKVERIYYERFAIAAWLKYADYSPFTLKKLKFEDLKRDELLESQIIYVLKNLEGKK